MSDTCTFGSFLISYMAVRMSTTAGWPNPSEVFALEMSGRDVPLLVIAIMTFVLINSSGTMALAVNFGYRRDRRTTAILLFVTAVLGAEPDYHVQGLLRWALIIVFLLLKAGLIMTIFMHLAWERLALVYAIVVPPLLLVTLVGIGALEADCTWASRGTFFAPEAPPAPAAKH